MYKITIEYQGSLVECVCQNIKNLRKNKGMTQYDLANKTTLSRSSWANIEKGNHKLKITDLEEICKIFNCKSSDILPF